MSDTKHTPEPWYPNKDPVTGSPLFMVIEHPQKGYVPTYGGPFDSYTLSERDDDESEPDAVHFMRERFDHDEGCWTDSLEMLGIVAITERRLDDLESEIAALRAAAEKARELIQRYLPQFNRDPSWPEALAALEEVLK